MSRIFRATVLALMLLAVPMGTLPGHTGAAEVSGQALSTDIRAYVNGQMLPCLIINDRCAIAAQDLCSCGFDVAWQPMERKLEITPTGRPIDQPYSQACQSAFTGPAGKIPATDIKTLVDQKEIVSLDIDGCTAIYLSDLSAYGEIKWDPVQREVRFNSRLPSEDTLPAQVREDTSLIAEEIGRREGIIEFCGENQYYRDQPVGYAQHGKAMISLNWMAGWLGYQVQVDPNSYLVKRGAHSFRVKPDERLAQVFYDGLPVRSVELSEPPVLSSSRLYLYSLDLEALFGLDSQWDQEKRQWKVRYAEYRIQESGGYRGGSWCSVKARYQHIPAEFNIPPELSVVNATLISENSGRGHSYSYGDGQNYTAVVPLEVFRDNDLRIWLGKKDRVLFYRQVTLQGNPHDHTLEREKYIGPFTQYSLEKPEQGFNRTTQNSFLVQGQVGFTNEAAIHIVPAKIDKSSGQVTRLPQQTLPLGEQRFSGPVALNAGPGLYRIHFEVIVNGLHGATTTAQFGEFYLEYCTTCQDQPPNE